MAKKVKEINEELLNEDFDEIDEIEEIEEVKEKPAKKTKGEVKEKPAKKPVRTNIVTCSQLAEMLGTDSFKLRAYLRKYHRDMTKEKGKAYEWEKDSEELQAIIDGYKAAKEAPVKRETTKKTKEKAEPVTTVEDEADDLDDLGDLDDLDDLESDEI